MKRFVALLGGVLAVVLGAAGCSAPTNSESAHRLGKTQTGAGGSVVLAAPRPGTVELRLGYIASPDDAVALVGIRSGLFRAGLGSAVGLDVVRFASTHAVAMAVDRGELDAAYLDPVAAVGTWQATHAGIRVISGASSVDGESRMVLLVTGTLLARHHLWVTGLLKGQVQAMRFLVADPIAARQVVAQALDHGRRARRRRIERLLAKVVFTCDPLAATMLHQARRAAVAGTIAPVRSLSEMYDLTLVNQLLRAAGFRPVGISDS